MMFQVYGNYTLLTPAQLCNVSLDYDKPAHMSFVNLETAYDGDMVVGGIKGVFATILCDLFSVWTQWEWCLAFKPLRWLIDSIHGVPFFCSFLRVFKGQDIKIQLTLEKCPVYFQMMFPIFTPRSRPPTWTWMFCCHEKQHLQIQSHDSLQVKRGILSTVKWKDFAPGEGSLKKPLLTPHMHCTITLSGISQLRKFMLSYNKAPLEQRRLRTWFSCPTVLT